MGGGGGGEERGKHTCPTFKTTYLCS